MVTFKLLPNGGGFYLSDDLSSSSQARVGFLFQDPTRTDPQFQLSQQTWTDPDQQGYFVFFTPSASRDWSSFATQVRHAFAATSGAQFGWFPEPVGGPTSPALVTVANPGTASPAVQSPFSLIFQNVSLQFQVSPFSRPAPTISFHDATNAFEIINSSVGNNPAIQLLTTRPGGSLQTYYSPSAALVLPLLGPQAGSVNATFQLDTSALEQFEAGLMYFGPPPEPGYPLLQLRYPVFRAPGGASTPLNLDAWLDVLQPLVPTRSFFQFTDARLGSYLASTTGRPFALLTVNGNGSGPTQTSRLVFANRPVNSTSDTGSYYYLTPAGQFGLGIDTTGSSPSNPPLPATAGLLCGVTGTEFLVAAVPPDGTNADALCFVPSQPAYAVPPPAAGSSSNSPNYLDDGNGNVTTSWVQFLTTSGAYISQPQSSPLYQQASNNPASLAGAAPPSGLSVYLLDFLPLPTWSASPSSGAAAAPTSSPAVPLVPYAGIPFASDPTLNAAQFLNLEATALNPTRKSAFSGAAQSAPRPSARSADDALNFAMTPQGLLAGLAGSPPLWTTLQIATSPAGVLQFQNLNDLMRQVLQQNQIFAVISSLAGAFQFGETDQQLNIADWLFNLSPEGTKSSQDTPPILILKFYPGQSIQSLVGDTRLWSQPGVFNPAPFDATAAQSYLQGLIQTACEEVYGAGNCPGGAPPVGGTPDTTSLYYNFYQVVTDPNFTGVLAVNCNMQLNQLPPAIRAVMGGMASVQDFRVHHVGVAINDTDPNSTTPTLAQSSLFGLVDYEKPSSTTAPALRGAGLDYGFEVEYLRALFLNSELRSFACQINLTVNSLFGSGVNLDSQASTGRLAAAGDGGANVIAITGAYQAHATTGDAANSGQGVYSFVAEGQFVFTFPDNPYLDKITLSKLQFSFDQETPVSPPPDPSGTTTHLESHFGIWGNLAFKQLEVLDIFSFEQLAFADLGISVGFDLTIPDDSTQSPTTSDLSLTFAPGDLRLDLGATKPRKSDSSLLSLIPFKLKSFLYSEHADQSLESLNYYGLSAVPGLDAVSDYFNYALIFDLDLGSLGGLVGSLSAFKFSVLIGWKNPTADTPESATGGDWGIAFGVQLPQVDGKLEIKIEGVLTISIEQFTLIYATDTTPKLLVLGLQNAYMEVLGQRLPPTGTMSFGLFAPPTAPDQIGWIAAYNKGEDGGAGGEAGNGGGEGRTLVPRHGPHRVSRVGDGESSVFELVYLGVGQRVGPDPQKPPTTFADFLKYMQGDFWEAIKNKQFAEVYHPQGQWLVITDFKLLGVVEVGFVFYDVTPFYSLVLNVAELFNFEITYTKVSDTIGLFYAKFSLPDSLRTFEVGEASITLPSLGVSVYTNGNWKVDLGFPVGDDWSGCFQIQAIAWAGPVPIPLTGGGGFYVASLSSATDPDVFKGSYQSILAFGFAAQIGVGKHLTAGPLSAGVSLTFFGIIQGAAGYLQSSATEIFQKPDALSLQGQFGVIGELYGSLDFVLVKASLNVRLQASIGVVLTLEPPSVPGGGDGSILLYIEASVSVSVRVSIHLFIFTVHVSFSYSATLRFQWLISPPPSNQAAGVLGVGAARTFGASSPIPLCPGLSPTVPLWFLPELTVLFPDATTTGVPWFVCSLGLEYDPSPPANPTFAEFKPFEAVATQLVTWALVNVGQLSSGSATVTLDQLNLWDQNPDLLVGWVDYPTLLAQLACFTQTSVSVPSFPAGTEVSGAVFPMFPFLELQTTGRLDGTGNPADLAYQFSDNNLVTPEYLQVVDDYFNQLFVNQSSNPPGGTTAGTEATTPLAQEIFLDYFTGLIRGAVHQLLQTLQDEAPTTSLPLDQLIQATVGGGGFATLAGQMSGTFRGGARLPYAAGQTLPAGSPDPQTNPLYALLWQEFPVGTFGTSGQYTIGVTNADPTNPWVTANVAYPLTQALTSPYQNLQASALSLPTQPVQTPFTQQGPQAFPFQNAVVWTQPAGTAASLRPFPSNLAALQGVTAGPINVLVQSRQTGAPYLPGGQSLDTSAFTWATMIQLTVKQVPAATGSSFLPDVYALSGANPQDQLLLQALLEALNQGQSPVAAIQVLYQASAGVAGLISATVNTPDVFVLRTNTTTASVPPLTLSQRKLAAPPTGEPAVGANLSEVAGFLEIIQQAVVTNAPGYYLRYQDAAGANLPAQLFSRGPGALTLLVTYQAGSGSNQPTSPAQVYPFYNAIILAAAQPGLLYYAETTDPGLDTQYSAAAAGTVGLELTRSEDAMLLRPSSAAASVARMSTPSQLDRAALIRMLVQAGVTDENRLRQHLTDSGDATSALNALYSLMTYQVEATTGFIASNVSAPIQPQKNASTDTTQTYRLCVPLYNVAQSNQSAPAGTPLNRYASLGDDFTVQCYLTDAFGNQLPAPLSFSGANL